MPLFAKELGIDLGTINTLVCERGEVVLHEPTVVAIASAEAKIVAVGQEARDMYGRAPDSIEVMRPLRDGVIADYEVTQKLLEHVIAKVCGSFRLFRPHVIITVPYGVTSVESRAVQEATLQAGAREAFLIPEPLAGAIGADLPVSTPTGNMVVDLGGGASEAAVVSMNGIVAAHTVRTGGMKLDEAIIGYVRKKYGLVIGDPTAEEIKIQIGAAYPLDEELTMEVQGRDQVNGLPRSIEISSGEVVEALQEPTSLIVGAVKAVLEKTPPELASDIIDRGMVLCGGGSLLRNIDKLLTKETGVPTYVAENPLACVALGTSKAFRHLDLLRRVLTRP
ncbi:MAG: rod shape-determining protein [Anaerolineales bacterium]|nr:rod shape-determining protein [Anaerolineales bacterium]